MYEDGKRNAHESKIQRGDNVLSRQEKEHKLSTTYKQSPFAVVQKNGNSILVEADGIQYRRNVTLVKKYLERDSVPQTTSKSSETTEAQVVTPGSTNQEFRESVKVSPGMNSGEKLLGYKPSDDATTWQNDSTSTLRPSRVRRLPSRLQDYVIGCIQ